MTTKRQLDKVIDQMLELIPENEVELRTGLEHAKYDAAYKAPENQYICWTRAAEVLSERFGDTPSVPEGWPSEIRKIWMGG